MAPRVLGACIPLTPLLLILALPGAAFGYVEAPHTLGRCIQDSTNVVLIEVDRVNTEKGLIIFKKVEDLKGKHPEQEIKHNIGKRGFHPREWQNVMAWAEPGKRAVFFHNGSASETCIGTYWYQCYREGEWWGMSHAEPFLLRTYYGDVDKLAAAVTAILKGEEVIITCLADGNKNELHQRKGKLQMMRASLKRIDYNVKRDFVGFGGDPGDIVEYRTTVLLPSGAAGWKFIPQAAAPAGDGWREPDFDDRTWRSGKAPVGYGEDEIRKRDGTTISEPGQSFLFRHEFEVPADLLAGSGITFRLCVASDDSAVVYLNGQLADEDPAADHEFTYWNRDVELPARLLRPGRNVLAALVRNRPGSSDLYLDVEISAQAPLPRKSAIRTASASNPASPSRPALAPEKLPAALVIDRERRTITIPCAVAPRKLPHLREIYPIEVVACYPAPQGQKAHETIVTFTEIKPSHVHQALVQLGLKPGQPAKGEGARAEGPEVRVYLELSGPDGRLQRVPVEKTLVDKRSGKPLPPLTWHFTGSAMKQPDPEKDDKVYGADLTGTLIALFPVTDETVIQTNLTMKEEATIKLEIAKGVLPPEGTPIKLVIAVQGG
ncbi:MAG TPA: YdjY domain-containing protein [Gemmataceae bacterium]|jgi:hypothetical protein|nr:YdjY domain-containing protein [Gemmataceae bacterium]